MTWNPYDYGSPVPDTRPDLTAQQQPWNIAPMPAVGGPLDNLQSGVAAVLNASQNCVNYIPGPQGSMMVYPRPQPPSVIGAALRGAIYGLAGALLWRRVRGRRAGRHRAF